MESYKSNPDIFKERVVFLSNDDVWEVSVKGGKARRITSGIGVINNVRYSPDGKYIVFRVMRGNDAGITDIYKYDFHSGETERLTFLSGKSTSRRMYTDIAGWDESGNPVISTDVMSPFTAQTFLYSLSIENLSLNPLNLGQASHVIFHDGQIFLGRNTIDMLHWKGYRGGTKGHILKGKPGSDFQRLFNIETHVASPVICQDRVYFISDHEGRGQIYSTNAEGEDLKRHTDFKQFYPRHLNSDGKNVVFSMGGSIYLFNPEKNRADMIHISMESGSKSKMEHFVNAGKYLEEFDLSSRGDMVSIIARGQGFICSMDLETQVKVRAEGRIRLLKFLNPEKIIFSLFSDGKDRLCVREIQDSNLKICEKDYGLIEGIYPSPDGKSVAVTNNRLQMVILETGSFKEIFLEENKEGRIEEVSWSPDSRSMAYTFPVRKQFLGGHQGSIIMVYDLQERKSAALTTGNSRDYDPIFDPEGRGIYYLSDRTLDPVPDKIVFDFGFPNATKPYFIPFEKSSSMISRKIPAEMLPRNGETQPGMDLSFSSEALKVSNGDYRKILPLKEGVLLLEYPVEGSMKYYSSPNLYRVGSVVFYSNKSGTSNVISTGVADFVMSGDRNVLMLKKAGNTLSMADIKISNESEGIKLAEKEIDLSRIKIRVQPIQEWKLMFSEAWKLAVENYWNREKAESVGPGIYDRYSPLLDAISTRYELSEIMREMQGEFGTSHSYEMGGDVCEMEEYPVGKLGSDIVYRNGEYVIERIYSGDPSNENEKSPLLTGTSFIEEKDVILSIDGVDLDENNSPGKVLYNRYETPVRVDLKSKDGKRKTVFVKPVQDDRYLRYRSWVEEKRDYVHKKSDGRIGYLHIPDMGMNGFSEFFRLYGVEAEKEGLIVDVRYNGGGSVSQLLLEKLQRKRLGYDIPRRGNMHPYPADSVNGPVVAITNESAGSDGDIFSHAFKLLGIGPVIGTRTWGGVVGISPRRKLMDGTTVTQPEFALWFGDVGFGIENYGTEPEIVEYMPQDYSSGRDPQLEEALKRTMKLLEEKGHVVDFRSERSVKQDKK